MAIRIRTGANGSYKSSYVAYYSVLEALKAGRIVVTNISGMQPLEEIEKRLDITFPSTAKLIRIYSRNAEGLELWQYFFCWCPIGALIVIDECQDIFSKNIGFDLRKIKYRPLSDFLDHLPDGYENLFNSRHIPVDLNSLDPADVDDCGKAEYDENGRIIYPFSFNEGFMRHRHYNWDIELLSPDWKQIDSGIKACAEECFFHKGRDGFRKRRPYVYRHKKDVTTPSIPAKRDPNLFTPVIPLDAFLLYKSTSTGEARSSGQMNMLFKNPMFLGVFLLGILCLGYFVYGVSGLVFGSSEEVLQSQASQTDPTSSAKSGTVFTTSRQNDTAVSDGGGRDSSRPGSTPPVHRVDTLRDMLGLYDIQSLYYTGRTTRRSEGKFDFFITLEAKTPDGVYYLDDTFLTANNINYVHYADCFLKLTKQSVNLNVFCKPVQRDPVPTRDAPSRTPEINLF